ncbi:MAG: isoprenylcysteine carboxylmethyltransferase family protein [Gemmatimonadota bacterium]
MTPSFVINAALRTVIWFGLTLGLALMSKTPGASIWSLRTDGVVWLGGGILAAGLALHVWSTLTLARGEWRQTPTSTVLVTDGPFRYVRHPIYLAGILLVLGVRLLYPSWQVIDLVLPLGLLAYFHLAVVRVEEPELRRRFGASYDAYCARVPRWLPRRPVRAA